jgi:hypothetical protein
MCILTGFLPFSYELRYWMYTVLCLAAFTLYLLQKYDIREKFLSRTIYLIQVVILIFIVGVNKTYLYPSRDFLKINPKNYSYTYPGLTLPDGDKYCIANMLPRGFLYKMTYPDKGIQSADGPADCIYPLP